MGAISVAEIVFSLVGRRELMLTSQPVTFDFNEIFHTCNAMNVPTSFCGQYMSENAFEFSQFCGSDLSCEHNLDSLMEILESAKSTTLAQVESHTECPDLGMGFCLLRNILDGKFGPVCDNLDAVVIDNCESHFAGMNAEDFNALYGSSNMDCFCSRDEVQMELSKARLDVILFVDIALGIVGAIGRRNLDAAVVAHFDYGNIVEVCSHYSAFDMCEVPAESIVKQFEFLCLGEAECEVSVKDLNKLLKNNHAKPVTGC